MDVEKQGLLLFKNNKNKPWNKLFRLNFTFLLAYGQEPHRCSLLRRALRCRVPLPSLRDSFLAELFWFYSLENSCEKQL